MSAPPPMPDPEELKRRRENVPYHIDPKEVNKKEDLRARNWAKEVMKKNESKLDLTKWKLRDIVASGEPEPEDIDIKQVYPFPRLRWIIYRGGPIMYSSLPKSTADNCFSIMLLSGNKLLFTSTWATI